MQPQSREAWELFAQTFEYGWWALADRRGDPITREGLHRWSRMILERFGFSQDQFAGQLVLDVGCGPTGRLSWLTEGDFVALDPLADRYATLPWPAMERYCRWHTTPAEDRVDSLAGQVDFLFSINALDHCFDLDAVLANLHAYVKPGGKGFFSVDCDKHQPHDPTHPLDFTGTEFAEAVTRAGFTITREEAGGCIFGDDWRDSWGAGIGRHFWIARNP